MPAKGNGRPKLKAKPGSKAQTATYQPKPLDTAAVKIEEDIVKLSALLAENAHDTWASKVIAKGWRYGPEPDDRKKIHPRLLPFKELAADKQRSYRTASLDTIKSLLAMGYRIQCPDGLSVFRAQEFAEKAQLLVGQFKKPKLSLAELRRLWEERLIVIWSQSVEIYRRAVDAALKHGEGFLAFDIAAEGLQSFKDDLRLIQLQALALARTGATRRANAILEQLRKSGHQDEETLGILARTYKDFWQLAVDPDEKRRHLKSSFELYLEGYKRNRGYYSGINAASMGLIYGQKEIAQRLAQEVTDICLAALAQLAPDSGERYWLEATLAEAALILGKLSVAEEYYLRGSQEGGQSTVVLSRTRSQARLLLEHVGEDLHRLDHCFRLPRIAVFSGHMFDRLGRKQPRFPHTLEAQIRAEMEERLNTLNVAVGYSSLACGGDLIFTEALLARGGEVNVVLPFKKDDFKTASVEIMEGVDWGHRFDNVLKEAATVTVLSELGDANSGAAYDFCNQALSGLALLKSHFLGMDAVPIVVWDGLIGDGRGGTQSFVEFWQQQRKTPVEIIALDKYVTASTAPMPPPTPEPAPAAAPKAPAGPAPTDSISQEIKAMIFADIVGFTKLSEIQIPAFVNHFLGEVSKLMDKMTRPPIHKNTWGDAVCAVFDRVADAGMFALDLKDLVRETDWSCWGLPKDLNIRIALHAGPVFPCYDPVLKKLTFNGSHVNRTARIEPIAEEGQVYASEAFAALATADAVADFVCDYVGTKQLAKKYGAIPVFLVRRTR